MYSAKILCDSISPDNVRLTTLEITYPRIVHSEFMTHRSFSRNSSSSRSIPLEKTIKQASEFPFIPEYWGKNKKGMQAEEEISDDYKERAIDQWKSSITNAISHVKVFNLLGVHKQTANRLLEPFLFHTTIVTSTEWSNWDGLRRHKDAQPEIKKLADLMYIAREESIPFELDYGQYHLPLVHDYAQLKADGFTEEQICQISIGRCCRVSYLTHSGIRDPMADILLCNQLRNDGHMSPFEHVARPMTIDDAIAILNRMAPVLVDRLDIDVQRFFSGNLRGWTQFRKTLPFEYDYSKIIKSNE